MTRQCLPSIAAIHVSSKRFPKLRAVSLRIPEPSRQAFPRTGFSPAEERRRFPRPSMRQNIRRRLKILKREIQCAVKCEWCQEWLFRKDLLTPFAFPPGWIRLATYHLSRCSAPCCWWRMNLGFPKGRRRMYDNRPPVDIEPKRPRLH